MSQVFDNHIQPILYIHNTGRYIFDVGIFLSPISVSVLTQKVLCRSASIRIIYATSSAPCLDFAIKLQDSKLYNFSQTLHFLQCKIFPLLTLNASVGLLLKNDIYRNNPSSRNSPNPIKPCSLFSSFIPLPPPPHTLPLSLLSVSLPSAVTVSVSLLPLLVHFTVRKASVSCIKSHHQHQ